jgi:hypothetical protein
MLRQMLTIMGIAGMCAACGDVHLGDGYGRRTRTALDAQAENTGADGPGTLDAEDAKVTMAKHHNPGQQTGTGGAGYTGAGGGGALLIPTMSSSSGGSSSGSSSGSMITPINLGPK